jgi:hypothetical protein
MSHATARTGCDPDDLQKVLARQLRRIRNGERIEGLRGFRCQKRRGSVRGDAVFAAWQSGRLHAKKRPRAIWGPLQSDYNFFDGGAACFDCATPNELCVNERPSGKALGATPSARSL